MEKIRDVWNDLRERYQTRLVKIFLGIGLIASILININIISLSEGWLLSTILFAMLLFGEQLDTLYKKVLYPKLRFFESHNAKYNEDILAALAINKKTTAQLLEFSTYSVQTNLLQELVSKRYKIQLLLSHPDSTPNQYQRETIEKALRELMLMRSQCIKQQDFQIKCYRESASFRGRKIGDTLISTSWYTYGTQRIEKANMPEGAKKTRRPQDLEGHTNALINADLSSPEGVILENMFDRVFMDLWATAIPLDDVVESLSLE